MKRLILIVFLYYVFSAILPVFAQKHNILSTTRIIDSLQVVLKSQNDDTSKVNTLNRIVEKEITTGNYSIADSLATNALQTGERLNFKKGIAAALTSIGIIYLRQSDYQKALKYQLKSLAINKDIGNKKGIAAVFDHIGIIYLRQSNYQKALEYAFNAFTINQNIGDTLGIATTLDHIGGVYYNLGNYSKALEYYFRVLTIAQEIKDKTTTANVLCSIGIIYGEQGNYYKELEYMFKSLEIQIKIGNKDAIAIDLGNIGWNYIMQDNSAEALEYDLKAVSEAQEVGDKDVIANFLGDIGDIYYKLGDCTKALEYDFKAASLAREIGDIDEVSIPYSSIGKVYTKLKNYKQAKTFLDSALIFSKNTGDKKNIKITYGNLAILDSVMGNYKIAYSDYENYIVYRDSIMNQGTTQMEISYEFEKREDSIRAEYKQENIIKIAEMKRKKILYNSAILILALTVLLAMSLINRQQIRRKKDKIISEKEKTALIIDNQRMEAEKQRIADELSNAKKALEDHAKNMAEKNELLEEFKTDIEKLKNIKSKELEDMRIEQLEHLNKTTILTEDDWDKFKELFEQVYKGFLIRLKEKMPDLTQAEIRLICLTKLNLSTKQIGAILGISLVTIKSTRYRLRKKLNLSGKDDLNRIADSI